MALVLTGFFLALLATTLLAVLFEGLRIVRHLLISKRLTDSITKFERRDAQARERILFIGDSTGHGTGASDARFSIVGRIGADFPDAHIENASKTGSYLSRAVSLLKKKRTDASEKYDLIVIMLGGLHLAHGIPVWLTRRLLHEALASAKQMCRGSVVLVSPYNFGLAPLYRFPLSRIYQRRAKVLDALYRAVAAEEGVIFVSHFREGADWLSERNLYARDKTHPNDEGYGILYAQMSGSLFQVLRPTDEHFPH